jgi:hypothetical protein
MTLREINLKLALEKHYATRVRNRFPPGSKYGKLTVVGYEKLKSGWAVKCACDCGGEKTALYPNQMRRGLVSSCGCVWKESRRINCGKHKPFRLPAGEAAFNAYCRSYVRNAKARGLNFDLTLEQVSDLAKKDCVYCGDSPSEKSSPRHYNGKFVGSGIDRTDPSKGYTSENCVPCCKICNHAKWSLSQQEFLQWIDRLIVHRSSILAP